MIKPNQWLILWVIFLIGCSPEASIRDTQGQEFTLTSLKGNWVLVNYWAIWCKPCIREIPELNKIDAERPDIKVLGFNYDRHEMAVLKDQMKALGVKFQVVLDDPGEHFLEYSFPRVLPTTLIINPQGKLAKTLIGPQTFESLTAHLVE